MEDALEEVEVVVAGDLVHAQRGPGVHRRVDVAERPLVRGQLAVRVHVPLAAEQDQLRLRELRVDVGERDAVEGEIPGRVPRVLPRVGHRDHVHVVEVRPLVVAAVPARVRRRRAGRVAVEPAQHVVVEELLAPRASRRAPGAARAPRRPRRRRASARRRTRRPRARARAITVGEVARRGRASRARRSSIVAVSPGGDLEPVAERGLRARLRRVDGRRAVDDVVADPVLRVRRRGGAPEERARRSSRSRRRAPRASPDAERKRVPRSSCSATMRAVVEPERRLRRRRRPTTTCCGTRASAARRSSPPRARRCAPRRGRGSSSGEAFA